MFLRIWLRPPAAVAAENLFLRKQLGLFVERQVKPRRATDSIRFTLVQLSRWFDWREALIVVRGKHLPDGTAKVSVYFGDGNRGPAAVLQCPPMCESSSERWLGVIQLGARSALPMNSC
jgi:hypothetical protein